MIRLTNILAILYSTRQAYQILYSPELPGLPGLQTVNEEAPSDDLIADK